STSRESGRSAQSADRHDLDGGRLGAGRDTAVRRAGQRHGRRQAEQQQAATTRQRAGHRGQRRRRADHRVGWIVMSLTSTTNVTFPALGTTASLLLTESCRAADAERLLRDQVDAIDATCSRFRRDSELSWLHDHAGAEVTVSPLLAEAIDVALRAA